MNNNGTEQVQHDEEMQQDPIQLPADGADATARLMALEALVRNLQHTITQQNMELGNLQQRQGMNQATTDQQAQTIDQQAQTINNLQHQLNNPPAVAPAVAPAAMPTVFAPMEDSDDDSEEDEPELGRTLKAEQPAKFNGDTAKLRAFLDDLRTYFEYYFPQTFSEDKVEKRIRYGGTRMEGAAADWFNAILKDKKKNDPEHQTQLTKDVFESYENFEEQLEKSFGITNEAQEAEKKLRDLKQKGPCYKHTSTFIQLLTKVNWTEDSKKEMYYYSLKPEVKDEIYKMDRQTVSFTDLTQEAIKIDNRQWERKQERKTEKTGNPIRHQPQANQGKKRDDYVAKDNGTRPGRMDIDAINHRKFKGTCNSCGKPGHKEADCRSKQTCGFCGKKGHQEAYCYSKKKWKKP
jgi:hypothetical protein